MAKRRVESQPTPEELRFQSMAIEIERNYARLSLFLGADIATFSTSLIYLIVLTRTASITQLIAGLYLMVIFSALVFGVTARRFYRYWVMSKWVEEANREWRRRWSGSPTQEQSPKPSTKLTYSITDWLQRDYCLGFVAGMQSGFDSPSMQACQSTPSSAKHSLPSILGHCSPARPGNRTHRRS